MLNTTLQTPCGESYFVSPIHRQKRPTIDKSIWTIDIPIEINCFNMCFTQTWYVDNTGWGVLHNGSVNSLDEVGINYENTSLILAKFVRNGGIWHGYPADVNKKPQDRPAVQVLENWMVNNIINKPLRARIQGGRL